MASAREHSADEQPGAPAGAGFDSLPPRRDHGDYLTRLIVKTGDKVVILKTAEIDAIESAGNYVAVQSGKISADQPQRDCKPGSSQGTTADVQRRAHDGAEQREAIRDDSGPERSRTGAEVLVKSASAAAARPVERHHVRLTAPLFPGILFSLSSSSRSSSSSSSKPKSADRGRVR